jgi:hypothetical protein
MAIQAKSFPGLDKIEWNIGGVRIMTPVATTLFHNRMVAHGLIRNDRLMANHADLSSVGGKKLSMGGGMRVMTFRTLPALHR